jgi:high-affinity nickel-transport protein
VPLLFEVTFAGGAGLLGTALVLGIRHGFDWDHIAAISDVTSTTTAAEVAEEVHEAAHAAAVDDDTQGVQQPPDARTHIHAHGGPAELAAHRNSDAHAHVAGSGSPIPGHVAVAAVRPQVLMEQRRALLLGTLYALGHALVVAFLGTLALLFGAVLPDWADPIMGRVVGVTLVLLGTWVFVSLYQYARHGRAFRLRSRWMLVFDTFRYGWRKVQARLHGHEHADPMEMTAYGPKTALGVGMIHGIGAETGTQVLLIAAIGGASSQGLGLPMMLAFIVGLLISNSIVVFITATGFIASRVRERLYIAVGVVAGTFSLVIGAVFLLQLEGSLPALDQWLESIGIR